MHPAQSPRKSPRQQRSQLMVEVILEGATRVFAEVGFEAATTNRIAQRAGVSVGSLYQYFPNKTAILAALRRRHNEFMKTGVAAAFDRGAALPLEGALREINTHSVGYLAAHAEVLRMCDRHLPQEFAHEVSPMLKQRLHDRMDRFVEERRDEIAVDRDQIMRTLPPMAGGILKAALHDRLEDLRNGRLIEELTSIMVLFLTQGAGMRRMPALR